MSITRKLALPAAGIATAAIAQGAGTAAAATVPHHVGVTTLTQGTTARAAARRARAVDILDHDPLGHGRLGIRPATASRTEARNSASIDLLIVGKGNDINEWVIGAHTDKTYPKAHLELETPSGTAWANTSTFDFKKGTSRFAGSSPYISWKGRWHAILWNETTAGHYTDVVSTYINVG
jgi:hypothetical protein